MSKAAITVIDLWPPETECIICDATCPLKYGIPRYEDVIFLDDYEGEWGGAPVCKRCFYVVRGMQEHLRRELTFAEVRAVVGER